jgi:hypothetical protein
METHAENGTCIGTIHSSCKTRETTFGDPRPTEGTTQVLKISYEHVQFLYSPVLQLKVLKKYLSVLGSRLNPLLTALMALRSFGSRSRCVRSIGGVRVKPMIVMRKTAHMTLSRPIA